MQFKKGGETPRGGKGGQRRKAQHLIEGQCGVQRREWTKKNVLREPDFPGSGGKTYFGRKGAGRQQLCSH